MDFLPQLVLIVWKYVLVYRVRRHWLFSILELTFMVVLFYGVWDESPSVSQQDKGYRDLNFDAWDPLVPQVPFDVLAYGPDTAFVNSIASTVADFLHTTEKVALKNMRETIEYMGNTSAFDRRRAVGIYFDVGDPSSLTYTVIAQKATLSHSVTEDINVALTPGLKNISKWDDIRVLLPIEHVVEMTFIASVADSLNSTLPDLDVRMRQFSYLRENQVEDSFGTGVSTLALRWLVGFSVPFCALILSVTREAHLGLKELLLLNGVRKSVYWLGHFLNVLAVGLPTTTVIVASLFLVPSKRGVPYYIYTSSSLVFTMLLLFCVLSILHAMVLSVFFYNTILAFMAAVVYWVFTAMFPYVVSHHLLRVGADRISRGVKLFTSISPFMSLHWCFKSVERYEKYNIGAHWSNFADRGAVRDNISLAEVMGLGVIFCCLQVLILWWLETPRVNSMKKRLGNIETREDVGDQIHLFEPDVPFEPIIDMLTVSKARAGTSDIRDLSVAIYDREITVFLGAADSGQDTVLDILVGKQKPDEGEVLVSDFSMVSEPDKARSVVSFCPSYNVAFNDLTIEENLLFFAQLRLDKSSFRSAVETLLTDLNLVQFKNDVVDTLSESYRRLLNVAIAMVMASEVRVVVLQEPTWNMELHARQDVWEMLLTLSRKRSIVMSTQNAEEADVIGDRIVIMRKGSVVCYGSSGWIRQKFGTGYRLHITKRASYNRSNIENCLRRHINGVSLLSDDSSTAIYILGSVPVAHKITALLKELEGPRTGIHSLSVSVTSLEDICVSFCRISTAVSGQEIPSPEQKSAERMTGTMSRQNQEQREMFAASLPTNCSVSKVFTVHQGPTSLCTVMQSMLYKRYLCWSTHPHESLFRYGIPGLLIFVSKFLEFALIQSSVQPARDSLAYNSSDLLQRSQGFVDYTSDAQAEFAKTYLMPLLRSEGVHTLALQANESLDGIQSFNQSNMRTFTYQFGISMSETIATLWYSGKGSPRAALIVTNLYHSSILRNVTRNSSSRLVFVSKLDEHQMELEESERTFGRSYRSRLLAQQLLMSFYLPMTTCFHSASFVFIPLAERLSKAKLLQLMTGVSGLTYWLTNLIFDVVTAAPCAAILAFIVAINQPYVGITEGVAMTSLLMLYSVAATAMTYLFSFVFNSSVVCYITVVLVLLTSGISGTHWANAQRLVEGWVPDLILQVFGFLSRLFPSYAMTKGVMKVTSLRSGSAICMQGGNILPQSCSDPAMLFWIPVLSECCTSGGAGFLDISPFSLYYLGSGGEALLLVFQAALYIVILSLLDSPLRQSIASQWGNAPERDYATQSNFLRKTSLYQNVEREANIAKSIVRTRDAQNRSLVALNLVQWDPFGTCVPVNDISFTLGANECMGLLGTSGSGRHSLMKVIVGDEQLVSGDAYMPNLTLRSNLIAWRTRIGYCPQEGGLVPDLTALQTVLFFSRLRGITEEDALDVAAMLFDLLDLGSPGDKCASYSNSDMKKVSLVIAILGSPSLLLLDDPCRDVDPTCRAKIRQLLKSIHDCYKIPIIVSMGRVDQDATFLDRVVVVEFGKIDAIASMQELVASYGRGVSITVQVPARSPKYESIQQSITRSMQKTFPSCVLYSSHEGLLTYHVQRVSQPWSAIFQKMTALKRRFHFQDFYVSDMTLQNAFTQLTKKQLYGSGVNAEPSA